MMGAEGDHCLALLWRGSTLEYSRGLQSLVLARARARPDVMRSIGISLGVILLRVCSFHALLFRFRAGEGEVHVLLCVFLPTVFWRDARGCHCKRQVAPSREIEHCGMEMRDESQFARVGVLLDCP